MMAKSTSEQVDGKHPYGPGSLEWRNRETKQLGTLIFVEDVYIGEFSGKSSDSLLHPISGACPQRIWAAPSERVLPFPHDEGQIQSNPVVPTEPSIPALGYMWLFSQPEVEGVG